LSAAPASRRRRQRRINPERDEDRNSGESKTKADFSALAQEVSRRGGTQRAASSALNDEKRPATFVRTGCGLLLIASESKYDSASG